VSSDCYEPQAEARGPEILNELTVEKNSLVRSLRWRADRASLALPASAQVKFISISRFELEKNAVRHDKREWQAAWVPGRGKYQV